MACLLTELTAFCFLFCICFNCNSYQHFCCSSQSNGIMAYTFHSFSYFTSALGSQTLFVCDLSLFIINDIAIPTSCLPFASPLLTHFFALFRHSSPLSALAVCPHVDDPDDFSVPVTAPAGWDETQDGETAVRECDLQRGYSGSISRACVNGQWGPITGKCQVRASVCFCSAFSTSNIMCVFTNVRRVGVRLFALPHCLWLNQE